MYGQLYHRTISRELPEPQRDPRGRVRRGGWLGAVDAMRAAKRDAYKTAAMNAGEMAGGAGRGGHKRDDRGGACGKQARPAPQGAKPVRPCRVPHAATAERPGGAGNIFAPCVISGSSTRKGALGGKIRAPCILNRPIAPGNGCIGRGCCHLDLEKHAFRADVARKRAFFAHSAKGGCIRCDSCQLGPRSRRNARGGRGRRRTVGAIGAMRAGLPDGNDLDDDSGSARWRHRGTRMTGAARRRWRCNGRRAGPGRWDESEAEERAES